MLLQKVSTKAATSSRFRTASLKVVSFCCIGVLETSSPSSSSSSCWPSSINSLVQSQLGSLCSMCHWWSLGTQIAGHQQWWSLFLSTYYHPQSQLAWAFLEVHQFHGLLPVQQMNIQSFSTSRKTTPKTFLHACPAFLKQMVTDETDSHACPTHLTAISTSTDLTTSWAVEHLSISAMMCCNKMLWHLEVLNYSKI